MPPRSKSGKGKGPATASNIPPEIEEEEEELRRRDMLTPQRKKRTADQIERDSHATWVRGMVDRQIKNERPVDLLSFGAEYPGIPAIQYHGLGFWFEPMPGYSRRCVVEFYQNMVLEGFDAEEQRDGRIFSTVAGKRVVITPDLIAGYWGYTQPPRFTCTYPTASPVDMDRVVNTLYEDPSEFGGTLLVPGRFKEEFRFLNKLVHANLYPRDSEYKPSAKGGEIICVLGSNSEVVNWARFVYGQLVDFREAVTARARMHFPVMITHFCVKAGVKGTAYSTLEPLVPGILDMHQMKKSQAQSAKQTVRQPSSTSGRARSSLTTPPPAGSSVNTWLRAIFCQNADDVVSRRKTRRDIKEMKHRMTWQTEVIEEQSGRRYDPGTIVYSEEEEEVDDVEGDDDI